MIDLQLLTPGLAPRPQGSIFRAVNFQLERDGIKRAMRPIEENATPDHFEPGGADACEEAHAVELRYRACIAKDHGGEMSEFGVAEEASRNAVLSCQVSDRCSDCAARRPFADDIGPSSVEVGRKRLATPNHGTGRVEVGDRYGKWVAVNVVKHLIITLQFTA